MGEGGKADLSRAFSPDFSRFSLKSGKILSSNSPSFPEINFPLPGGRACLRNIKNIEVAVGS